MSVCLSLALGDIYRWLKKVLASGSKSKLAHKGFVNQVLLLFA